MFRKIYLCVRLKDRKRSLSEKTDHTRSSGVLSQNACCLLTIDQCTFW